MLSSSAWIIDPRGLAQILQRRIGEAEIDPFRRSDLAEILEQFNRRGVALVSVAESLDTGSAAGRLVLNVMTAVSQWERETIGERTRDALRHKRARGVVQLQLEVRLQDYFPEFH